MSKTLFNYIEKERQKDSERFSKNTQPKSVRTETEAGEDSKENENSSAESIAKSIRE
jgi:hypothetical protein